MSVLEDIYRGSYRPDDVPHDSAYDKTIDHMLETEDLLKDTMNEKQVALFSKLQDDMLQLHQFEAETIFKAGAQFGAAIAEELWLGREK